MRKYIIGIIVMGVMIFGVGTVLANTTSNNTSTVLSQLLDKLSLLQAQLHSAITRGAPVCNSITLSNATITNGESVTLKWDTTSATRVTIDNGIGRVSVDGSKVVTPTQTTKYTLTLTNQRGTNSCSATVVVVPQPSCTSITISPETITSGKSATLKWDTANATKVSFNNGIGKVAVDGSRVVKPTATTEYIMTAENVLGYTATCSVTATVAKPSVSGTYSEQLISGKRNRSYHVYIPKNYDQSKSAPLLLIFHGGNGDGLAIMDQTKFKDKADKEGFILVAPDGYNKNWNDGRGTTDAETAGVDDIAFVRSLIAEIQSSYKINPEQVFATGVSNGAMFSQRIGCELSDVVTAVGSVVGAMPELLSSSCTGSVSLVGIQGTADPFIPFEGGSTKHKTYSWLGDGGTVLSAADTMKLWAKNNKCTIVPKVTRLKPSVSDGTLVTKYMFNNCADGKDLQYYMVAGMGHGWPPQSGAGRIASAITGPTSNNINATDVIWDFFVSR